MDEENKQQNNDDIHVEKDADLDDSVVAEESSAETIKKLRTKLKEAEAKATEYLSGWQRSQADFINFKKREAKEREEFLKFAAEPVISDFIEVLDNFDVAFQNKAEWEKVDKAWRDGVELIYNRMKSALTKNGVKVIDPEGLMFDPVFHMAVEMVSVKNADDDGKIVGVVHKGYSLNDRIIRPAKVKVGRHEEG